MKESLYIVLPAYNEAANIESVIREWYPMLDYGSDHSRIVVADGGSTDHTVDILYSLQKEFPRLKVFVKPGTDHGTKVLLLYNYAVKNKAEWIFQTDSDGQTLAKEFPEFWKLRKTYSIIMGNRIHRKDGIGRKVVEMVLRIYVKFFFGVMVPDANAPFRLMDSSIVEKYMGLIPKRFQLPNAVLAACFSKYNENVIYKEITFQPRQGGKNYMNLNRIFRIGLKSINDFSVVRESMKKYENDQRTRS